MMFNESSRKYTIGFFSTWPIYQGTTIDRYAHSLIQGISAAANEQGCDLLLGCGFSITGNNPHPHSQIWATEHIPVEPAKELERQKTYFNKNGRTLLSDYLMGFHQAPFDDQPHPEWTLHAHFYPPLLRSAHCPQIHGRLRNARHATARHHARIRRRKIALAFRYTLQT